MASVGRIAAYKSSRQPACSSSSSSARLSPTPMSYVAALE